MALGAITTTIKEFTSSAAVKTWLDTQSTASGAAGGDHATFTIIRDPARDGVWWVTKIDRAQS